MPRIMYRALTTRCLNRALLLKQLPSRTLRSTFLCPAIRPGPLHLQRHRFSTSVTRLYSDQPNSSETKIEIKPENAQSHVETTPSAQHPPNNEQPASDEPTQPLPLTCHGCGAFSQTSDRNELGYFDVRQKRVKRWLNPTKQEVQANKEDELVEDVLKNMDEQKLKELGLGDLKKETQPEPGMERSLFYYWMESAYLRSGRYYVRGYGLTANGHRFL